jgi:hypothetical protein
MRPTRAWVQLDDPRRRGTVLPHLPMRVSAFLLRPAADAGPSNSFGLLGGSRRGQPDGHSVEVAPLRGETAHFVPGEIGLTTLSRGRYLSA